MGQTIKQIGLSLGFRAAIDMSPTSGGPGPNGSKQYTVVKAATSNLFTGGVNQATASEQQYVGVVNNQPQLGQAAEVAMEGVTQMIVDGGADAIVAGDDLTVDSSGRGVKADQGSQLNIIGRAMEPSTETNDQIAVWLKIGCVTAKLD